MIIGQITDPHIKAARKLAYGKVDTAACLEAVVQHMNSFTPGVDAVIVTGDLTDMGRPEEYETLRPLLDDLQMPWFPVPGNHDEKTGFLRFFSDVPVLRNCQDFAQYAVEDFPLRLVGLDTTVTGKPYGQLCEARLEWLDRTLSEEPDKPTLLFMHHPPFLTGITHMDVQNLLNADAFFDCLKHHSQVRHIACGHVHRPIETCIQGIGVSIAPNAAHSVTLDLMPNGPSSFTLDPAGARLFRVDKQGNIISHVTYVGNYDGPYPFFEVDGQLVD